MITEIIFGVIGAGILIFIIVKILDRMMTKKLKRDYNPEKDLSRLGHLEEIKLKEGENGSRQEGEGKSKGSGKRETDSGKRRGEIDGSPAKRRVLPVPTPSDARENPQGGRKTGAGPRGFFKKLRDRQGGF